MTSAEFRATAIALLRTAVGWQSAIAGRLGVAPRNVRRWLEAGEIPDWVEPRLAELTGAADVTAFPRDEWLIGDAIGDAIGADGRRREYIVHLQPPRFAARIVAMDETGEPMPDERPADVVTGVVYVAGEETMLCEIDWQDEVRPGEHVKWLEAAADVIEAMGGADNG